MALAIGVHGATTEASIVYSGVVNLNIPATTDGLYLNVVTGAYNTSGGSGGTVPGWTINPWGSSNLTFFVSTSSAGTQHIVRTGGGAVASLGLGDMIGPAPIHGGWSSANLSASTTGNQPFVLNSTGNIYGFRFTLNGNTHYGWARIALGSSLTASPRTLIDYAWENSPNTALFPPLEPIGLCCFPDVCGYTFPVDCIEGSGTWLGVGLCESDPCGFKPPPCPSDIAPPGGDANVNVNDLLMVITNWGPCPAPPAACPADIEHDGSVNVNDLLSVITAWGPCPEANHR